MIKHISIVATAVFLASASGVILAQTAAPPGPDPLLPQAEATTKENPPKPIEGQIITQDRNTYLASTLIGSWVYAPDNTTIGDVNDVIIEPGGDVVGVVIGVGGFLGVGEKPVAVALNRLTISQTESLDAAKVVFNVSLAELEAAPAFKSAYAMKMDEEAEQSAIKDSLSMTAVPQTVPPAPATQ
jgi:hypothetical protein